MRVIFDHSYFVGSVSNLNGVCSITVAKVVISMYIPPGLYFLHLVLCIGNYHIRKNRSQELGPREELQLRIYPPALFFCSLQKIFNFFQLNHDLNIKIYMILLRDR